MHWQRLRVNGSMTVQSGTTGTNVVARYQKATEINGLEFNQRQHSIAVALDQILAGAGHSRASLRRDPRSNAARHGSMGAYIYGPVGSGKTMLMDMFYASLPPARKRRLHYTVFMREIHELLKSARQKATFGGARVDPIESVAHSLAQDAPFLCLDEFSLTDSADAAIVSRVIQKLLDAGVVIVATSNVEPDGLYTRGQNRDVYLPFIELIKNVLQVFPLDTGQDFRIRNGGRSAAFFFPLNVETKQIFDEAWEGETKGSTATRQDIELKGRRIDVPHATADAALFQFSDLCQNPLGALDFLAIAERFNTIFIDNVPVLRETQINEAKRFILLIDVFYDRRIRLFMRAMAPPSELYRSATEFEGFEFARTVSRLAEMDSATWPSTHTGEGHRRG